MTRTCVRWSPLEFDRGASDLGYASVREHPIDIGLAPDYHPKLCVRHLVLLTFAKQISTPPYWSLACNMAPISAHAVATAQSVQVLSHDEKAILVETGSFTPMRWFLERGAHGGQDMEAEDTEQPPKKRRKTSAGRTRIKETGTTPSPEMIPLAKITIDLHFSETMVAEPPSAEAVNQDVDFDGTDEVPVILYGIGEDTAGCYMRFAQPTLHGPVAKVELSNVPQNVMSELRTIALPRRQRAALPGLTKTGGSQAVDCVSTVTRCVLKRSVGELYNIVRLEASIAWKDGVSAFPAGFPTGRARRYGDYDLKARFFPDHRRDEVDHSKPWTPQDFYESVHTPDMKEKCDFGSILESELYPFQQRAVNWMLRRERVRIEDGRPTRIPRKELRDTRTRFYEEAQDATGKRCFVNHFEGILSRRRPEEDDYGISGGLLAEEMGLGKTVELMALISLHPRAEVPPSQILDLESGTYVRPSKATLIVTPASILPQWRSELGRHAPLLRVMEYTGIPSASKKFCEEDILAELSQEYDVVLTTYQVLSRELHFAEDPPERNMRRARKFERKRSPLVQVQFWRTVMDEAQMIESGVTAAARVACRLPRVNSWAVSGTPLKKNVQDLHGLLIFLRLKPLSDKVGLWNHMVTNHRHLFRQLFSKIALRHTKSQIRDELRLPLQKRVVINVPFTAVENQQYANLFAEMCEQLKVENDGSPVTRDWDPNDPATVEAMRRWLVRLRQTCLHPQVGGQNRRRLGRGHGPLRTVNEVLDVMIEQNEMTSRIEERAALSSELLRAHIVGNNREDEHRSEKALVIYRSAMAKSATFVEDARQRLSAAKVAQADTEGDLGETDPEDSSNEGSPLLGRLRNNLRMALELQHVCAFFAATACYQIKVNEALTKPDSEQFKNLEEQEIGLYEQAKALRREILADASRKSEALMRKMSDLVKTAQLTKLPKIKDLAGLGGIESRKIVEKSDDLFDLIREQGKVIVEWRAKMAEFLLKPLVDEDENGNEITGDEYEDSTKQQDELYVYFDALKAMQADLNTFITGEAAPLIDHEAKTLVRAAKRTLDPDDTDELKEPCHAPETLIKLFEVRNKFRAERDKLGSVRGLIQEARALETSVEWRGGSARSDAEAVMVREHIKALQHVFSSYTKALAGLEKEVSLFRSTQNQRLEFYRQLQELSDAVSPYKEELDENLDLESLEAAADKEELQNTTLAQLRTKHRFLLHLRDESGADGSPKICVICQCSFENGVLTVCGHQYCKECIQHWWTQHRTCPVCKRQLKLVDFHNITYKSQELRAKEEVNSSSSSPGDSERSTALSSPSTQGTIYSEVDSKLMDEIKSIDLATSYGTKIDTLGRHLLWIREHDPGAKSIVFSQFRPFLDVLASALSVFKIGHSRLGRPGAVEKFRHDPSIDCLLLDAKTDSSGLTLVNATHVFICEPLIQTAVELQAIARVHRIGQTRQTTVWMYLINDTVEESIYDISVKRRMAHVQDRQREGKSRSATPGPLGENAIEAADTEELQSAPISKLLTAGKSGGELVEKDDLWQCLFGKANKAPMKMDEALGAEFGRQLRGNAAERRRDEAS